MDAEYGRQATDLERRIMETRLAKEKIELQSRLAESNAQKDMATMEAKNANQKSSRSTFHQLGFVAYWRRSATPVAAKPRLETADTSVLTLWRMDRCL